MKICHVITRLIVGGAQENTVLTCRGLIERGHEVTLVAGTETGPEGSLWEAARASGSALVKVDSLRRAISPVADRHALHELKGIFQRSCPDVVHTHSSKAGILGRAAARAAQVPCVVHTIHGMSFNRTQPWAIRTLYKVLERKASRYTTHYIAVAEAMTNQAVAAGIADRDRFTTIRSGLDTDRFAPDTAARAMWRRRWGVSDEELIVGTIARLFENKGYEEIIQSMPKAVAKCNRLRFVWVGGGAHRSLYERRLKQRGLTDRVVWTGLLAPEEIGSVLNGVDLLVHASKWEGLPRALVQALLVEKPVVSFDNDGAPEVVDDDTGVLVRFGHIGGLAAGIVRLAQDPALRARLGSTGRRRCLEDFNWRTMVDRIEALYERLCTS